MHAYLQNNFVGLPFETTLAATSLVFRGDAGADRRED